MSVAVAPHDHSTAPLAAVRAAPRRESTAPLANPANGDRRLIETSRFGPIDAPTNQLLQFPLGVPGFTEAKGFVVVEHRPGSMFRWLQAVDVPELAFVVIDVLAFVPDYPVEDVRRSLAFCGLEADEEIAVLAICCVPPHPEPPTANFQAPLGIGLRSRRGAQILLHDSGFDMRMSFLPPK